MGRRIWYQWGSRGFPQDILPVEAFSVSMILKVGGVQRTLWKGDVTGELHQWARCSAQLAARLFPCDPRVLEYLATDDPDLRVAARRIMVDQAPLQKLLGVTDSVEWYCDDPRARAWFIVTEATESAFESAQTCHRIADSSAYLLSLLKPRGQRQELHGRAIGRIAMLLERLLLHRALGAKHHGLMDQDSPEAREVAIDVLLSRSQPASQVVRQPLDNNRPL